jgi:hypothetical protein
LLLLLLLMAVLYFGSELLAMLAGSLEDEGEVVEAQGPTMMSKEARQMFLSGNGSQALAMWKVWH